MNNAKRGYREFRAGWPVVVAAAVGIGLGLSPVPIYTIGVFAPHLVEEFGWGFGQIRISLTIMTFVILLISPLVGILEAFAAQCARLDGWEVQQAAPTEDVFTRKMVLGLP